MQGMALHCELVRAVVPVGVYPALPLDDVVKILVNDLAGNAVWDDVPLSLLVVSRPLAFGEPGESGLVFPEVFSATSS